MRRVKLEKILVSLSETKGKGEVCNGKTNQLSNGRSDSRIDQMS